MIKDLNHPDLQRERGEALNNHVKAAKRLHGILTRYIATGYSADWYEYQHTLTEAAAGYCQGCNHCCDTCNRDGHYCPECNDVVGHVHSHEEKE